MYKQTTKRLKCSDLEQSSVNDSLGCKVKKWVVRWVRFALQALLIKPATWHWLMVIIPEIWDKAAKVIKVVSNWIIDFN